MSLSHDPTGNNPWFRLFPLRSPLLRESRLFSLPPATKMFQFAGFALSTLWIQVAVCRVAPFGYLRINVYFQLPEAFRR
jgi:hypothetical protein